MHGGEGGEPDFAIVSPPASASAKRPTRPVAVALSTSAASAEAGTPCRALAAGGDGAGEAERRERAEHEQVFARLWPSSIGTAHCGAHTTTVASVSHGQRRRAASHIAKPAVASIIASVGHSAGAPTSAGAASAPSKPMPATARPAQRIASTVAVAPTASAPASATRPGISS